MITKEMILAGFLNGIVRLENEANLGGTVCRIGDYWFYFGGESADNSSAEDYLRNVPIEDIVCEVASVLEEFAQNPDEFGDEYKYYEAFLKEELPDAVLLQMPADAALTRKEVERILAYLAPEDREFSMLHFEGENVYAEGFIMDEPSEKHLMFNVGEHSLFGDQIRRILDDVKLETAEACYTICGVKLKLLYPEVQENEGIYHAET